MPNEARDNNCAFDHIEVRVSDRQVLKAMQRFYESAFGWRFQHWGDEYSDTESSGMKSGIAVSALRTGVLAVIFAERLEEACESVLNAGAKITKDIFSFPGGRRFEFRDPSGAELAGRSDR